MPSLFPGMDPYLEDPTRWGGVHLRMIVAIAAELNRHLPDGLVADLDEYVWLKDEDEPDELPTRKRPDAFVPDRPTATRTKATRTASTRVLTPSTTESTLPASSARKRRRVLIRTAQGDPVLTVIELLSPSNKANGPDRLAYLAKRSEYLASNANLVEIDLLRDGDRIPMGRPRPPVTDYYVLISEANRRPKTSIWAFTMQEPLPVLPIPLGRNYADVVLDLKSCLDRVYDEGRYETAVNYSRLPNPELDSIRATWANDLLAKRRDEHHRE